MEDDHGRTAKESLAAADREEVTDGVTWVPVSATVDPATNTWTWDPPAPNVVKLPATTGGSRNYVVILTIHLASNGDGLHIVSSGGRWMHDVAPPELPFPLPITAAPNQVCRGIRNDLTTEAGPTTYGFEASVTLSDGRPTLWSHDPEVVLDPP